MQALINYISKFVNLSSNAVKTIDYAHNKTHDGKHFTVSRGVASVANAASVDIRFKTGAAKCHLSSDVSISGKGQFFIYEAATISAGTALSAYNNNRTSLEVTTATITHTPTVTATGSTILLTKFFGSGDPGGSVGGEGASRFEFILAPNTECLIRLTNTSGTAQDLNIILEYYEE